MKLLIRTYRLILKCSYYCCLIFLTFPGTIHKASSQDGNGIAIPPEALTGSYTKYYSYYINGGADQPVGADLVSDALISVSLGDGDGWSAFLINSFREDGKICLCTAGHNVEGLPLNIEYGLDFYMKYLGRPMPIESDVSGKRGEAISSYKSLVHSKLVAMSNDAQSGDWAVLLVDRDEFVRESFGTLGYVFDQALYSPANPPGKFIIMAHPYGMPQRISDSLYALTSTGSLNPALSPFFELWPMVNRTKPGGMGPQASGSPVVDGNSVPFAAGIFRGGLSHSTREIPQQDVSNDARDVREFRKYGIKYSTAFDNTKMSTPALMAAIKNNCWKKSDSLAIESDVRYKKSVRLDNTQGVSEFQQTRAITSQAGLEAGADQSYGSYNVNNMLVKAATLTVNCLINNTTGKDKLYCLAKQAICEPGFSYLASGNKLLEINTVVPESIGSSTVSRVVPIDIFGNRDSLNPKSFTVYPNPSEDGVFYISFPAATESSYLMLSSMDGKQVYKTELTGKANPYRLALSAQPKGTYILSVHQQQSGTLISSKVIVYR